VVEVRAERVQFLGAPGQPKAQVASVEPIEEVINEPSTESTWLGESEADANES
jgi:hypothetical protein